MARIRLPSLIKDMGSCIFKSPSTCEYPAAKVEVHEGFRGKPTFDPEKCISCGLCERDCPSRAIELVEVSGKRIPMFYLDRCIFCYQCTESCPRKAIQLSGNFEMSTTEKKELMVLPEGFISKQKSASKEEKRHVA